MGVYFMPEQKGNGSIEIDSETEEALYDILDTIRDKVIEQNGQAIDWEIHKDTNLEQIVITWKVQKNEEFKHGAR